MKIKNKIKLDSYAINLGCALENTKDIISPYNKLVSYIRTMDDLVNLIDSKANIFYDKEYKKSFLQSMVHKPDGLTCLRVEREFLSLLNKK